MKKKRGKKGTTEQTSQIITEKVTTSKIAAAKDTTVGLKVRTTLDKETTIASAEKKAISINKKEKINLKGGERVNTAVEVTLAKKNVDTEKSLADIEKTRKEGQMKVIIQTGGLDRHMLVVDTPISDQKDKKTQNKTYTCLLSK